MSDINKPNGFNNRMNSRSYIPIKMSESKIELSDNININSSIRLTIGLIVLGVLLGGTTVIFLLSML